MKYLLEEIKIATLVELIAAGDVDLSPSYQRNEVWTAKAQKELIDSIVKGWPLPCLFILDKGDGKCEMVDGKQRSLAIYNYYNCNFKDSNGLSFSDLANPEDFEQYNMPVVRINNLERGELIEQFFAKVNSSGLRLNRPEVIKAEFSETSFHKTLTWISHHELLGDLDLFTARNRQRMNDYELLAEAVAAMHFGLFDKKKKVDSLYVLDEGDDFWESIRSAFEKYLVVLNSFNAIYPLKYTRFRKRADFYSLAYFYAKNSSVGQEDLEESYKTFVELSDGIAPSNDRCNILKEYAYHCTTQSNSLVARTRRNEILESLLANSSDELSAPQAEVLNYFGITVDSCVKGQAWYRIPSEVLKANRPTDHLYGVEESLDL